MSAIFLMIRAAVIISMIANSAVVMMMTNGFVSASSDEQTNSFAIPGFQNAQVVTFSSTTSTSPGPPEGTPGKGPPSGIPGPPEGTPGKGPPSNPGKP